MNVLSISKNQEDLISQSEMAYSIVRGCIYTIPLSVHIGIPESDNKIEEGTEYEILLSHNFTLKMILDRIDPSPNTISGYKSSEYVFLPITSSKLYNNKFRQGASAWGIKLDKYLNGDSNQLKLAHMELRKKSTVLCWDEKLKVIQKHTKAIEAQEPKYIANINFVNEIKSKSKKQNYSTGSESDGNTASSKGNGGAIYIPFAKKSEIKAMDVFIEVALLVESKSENTSILLGDAVMYKQEKFIVVEKVILYIDSLYQSVFALGRLSK